MTNFNFPLILTPEDIVKGNVSLLFAHPETLLSLRGRELLKSKPYRERVVAFAIDEAHIVEIW